MNGFQLYTYPRKHVVGTIVGQTSTMTAAQCQFAHQPNVIANGWLYIDPTSLANQACHDTNWMSTIHYQTI